MILNILLLAALIAYGVWEYRRHQRNVDRVRFRILVNGTRGKSSVTRLITAGLQAGGIRTLGKSTGTKPCMILPDGREIPIPRVGKANIIEQAMVFRRAVDLSVDAAVVECMAVIPYNQRLMERGLVRSTVGVITNVRADHLDEMGPTLADVARSLALTMPSKGVLFTCEQAYLPVLEEEGRARGTRVVGVTSSHITDEMMMPFSYIEHKDNVALALAVCEEAGIPAETALQGMHCSVPDPGVLRIFRIHHDEKEIEFVNAFAANDPDSYVIIWALLQRYFTPGKKVIAVVNCREDRIQRTESMAELIAKKIQTDYCILVGVFTTALLHKALAMGMPAGKIIDLGGSPPEEVFHRIAAMTGGQSIIIGVGNIVIYGEELVRQFTEKGREIVY